MYYASYGSSRELVVGGSGGIEACGTSAITRVSARTRGSGGCIFHGGGSDGSVYIGRGGYHCPGSPSKIRTVGEVYPPESHFFYGKHSDFLIFSQTADAFFQTEVILSGNLHQMMQTQMQMMMVSFMVLFSCPLLIIILIMVPSGSNWIALFCLRHWIMLTCIKCSRVFCWCVMRFIQQRKHYYIYIYSWWEFYFGVVWFKGSVWGRACEGFGSGG